MSKIKIVLQGILSYDTGSPSLPKLAAPVVTPELLSPAECELSWGAIVNAGSYRIQAATDSNFTDFIHDTIENVLIYNLVGTTIPLESFYFRAKAIPTNETIHSSSDYTLYYVEVPAPVSLGDSELISTSLLDSVALSWDSMSASFVEEYQVQKLLGGTYVTIATSAEIIRTYEDEDVLPAETYSYRIKGIPNSLNYAVTYSNQITVTVASAQVILAAPTNVTYTKTGTDGQVLISFSAVTSATNYSIFKDDVEIGFISTTSILVSSLTLDTNYEFKIIASAAGFTPSLPYVGSYTPTANSSQVIELNNHGAVPYCKYLDGRTISTDGSGYVINGQDRADGETDEMYAVRKAAAIAVTTPTVTLIPFSADNSILNGTNLTGVNYTKVVSPVSIFTIEDVNKEFVGLYTHIAPVEVDPLKIDFYPPGSTTSWYSTVVKYISSTEIIVDFEYNGGNRLSPQIATNVKAYIFAENTAAFASAYNEWRSSAVEIDTIIFSPCKLLGDGVVQAYVVKEIPQLAVNVNKDLFMRTEPNRNARVKFGIEHYYNSQVSQGQKFYNYVDTLFAFGNSFSKTFCTNRIELIPPHSYVKAQDSLRIGMFIGNRGAGISAIVHGNNYRDMEEISDGIGITFEAFVLSVGYQSMRGGTVGTLNNVNNSTTNVLHDVLGFSIAYFNNCHFEGGACGGALGGSTKGSTMHCADGTIYDFEDEVQYLLGSQEFEAKFTTDYSNLDPSVTSRNYYPEYVLEITSPEGDFFKSIAMGSNVTNNLIHIDKFIFMGSASASVWGGLHQFAGGYDLAYAGAETPNEWGGQYTTLKRDYTAKKHMLLNSIPKTTEAGGILPKLYSIQRDYLSGVSDYQLQTRGSYAASIPTVGLPIKNAVRTFPNWCTILGKYSSQFTLEDRLYIREIDRIPLEFQIGDSFRLCSWVELDDVSDISIGDTIVGYNTLDEITSSGIVRYVDTYLKNNRVIIGNSTLTATVSSFENTTRVLIAGVEDRTVTLASSFDSQTVYTIRRKQFAQLSQGGNLDNLRAGVRYYTEGDTTYEFFSHELARGMVHYGEPVSGFSNFNNYRYSMCHITPDLPDEAGLLFEAEMVNSEAEYLLDGNSRPALHAYNNTSGYGNNGRPAGGVSNRRYGVAISSNGGIGYGDLGFVNPITAFKTQPYNGSNSTNWFYTGAGLGHLWYSVGEHTIFLRRSKILGFTRTNATQETGYVDISLGDGGSTVKALSFYSKGIYITECPNLPTGQWLGAGTAQGRIRDQWDRQRRIHLAYPTFTPKWAADEELPFPPKVRYFDSPMNNNHAIMNPELNLIQESSAILLPKSVRNLLILLD
jgi:hypothetical protein